VMHSHDADSEACLNRQMLNNSVKRKTMEDLCERLRNPYSQSSDNSVARLGS